MFRTMLDVPLCAGVGANCAVTFSLSRSAENVPGWKYRWNLTEYWVTRPIGSAGCVIQHALQPWISDTSSNRVRRRAFTMTFLLLVEDRPALRRVSLGPVYIALALSPVLAAAAGPRLAALTILASLFA